MALDLRSLAAFCLCANLALPAHAAAECDGGGDGLGVARVLEVDTSGGPTLGTFQYATTLPLEEKEVVLTFDDGPHPRNTRRVLDALDRECVKATFFPVGIWAKHLPNVLQEVAARGHTIGAHSWSHPANLARLSQRAGERQIERGFLAVSEAVGGPIAPFFRYPGLNDSRALNDYAARRGYAVFSCDIGTDDWRGISAHSIVNRALARLERMRRGILLFHDTRGTTASALPLLFKEFKARGYKIVHVVPRVTLTAAASQAAVQELEGTTEVAEGGRVASASARSRHRH